MYIIKSSIPILPPFPTILKSVYTHTGNDDTHEIHHGNEETDVLTPYPGFVGDADNIGTDSIDLEEV